MIGMWTAVGLSVGFLVLASLLLWFLVRKKGSLILNAAMILGVLWYGLALYHTQNKMLGWPCGKIPDAGIVLSWTVIEPSIDAKEAGIYVWIVPEDFVIHKERTFLDSLDPRKIWKPEFESVPRSFKFPYSEEEHDELAEASREARKKNGVLLFKRPKDAKMGEGSPNESDSMVEDDSSWIAKDAESLVEKGTNQ